MDIIWADKAFRAWSKTADYILSVWGISSVEQFQKKTEGWQNALAQNPLLGKVEPLLAHRTKTYRSIAISKQNKLIYYIEDKTIIIVDFWDTRREPKKQANRIV